VTDRLVQFDVFTDDRGSLVALESGKNVPFVIKRVYYMTEMAPDRPRGFHAHRNLEQIAICVKGSCYMIIDDGNKRETFLLDEPGLGVCIHSMEWREMHSFSADCVLLVVASEHYDASDYLRDYSGFLKERGRDTSPE
jgi:dTDP-4-dehydrorhamnose 3,5-epimerase-like enzyme